MAKVTTKRVARKQATTMTLGIDLGDRTSMVFGFDAGTGELSGPKKVPTTPEGFQELLEKMPPV